MALRDGSKNSGEDGEVRRRSSFVEHEVVYTAVGASADADLMRFPPTGSTPFQTEHKLGSGAERFLAASSTLMTWGAQRAIGIDVRDVQQSDSEHYSGVSFDEAGAPQPAPQAEVRYSPDGEPYLRAGATAVLAWANGKIVRKVRIVYTVDEPRRVGFSLGSVDSKGVVGEELYVVEQREDDSVWGVARGFHLAPESGLFGVRARAGIRLAERDAVRLLEALAPGAAMKAANGNESD